ncbi:MAG: AAA family ATPase, partial [Actinomycetota bacterium]|nr:AAA family ATPase [Actinomycetota bacterium]
MLGYLRVKDFALIEDVELQFFQGLNVLTGETGAGKTVLVEALSLLLGDRADSTMVRDGANEALLTCTFELKGLNHLLDALQRRGFVGEGEEDISLSRTIPRNGKSRSFINGRACQVSDLTDLGGLLVDIHGQNSHQALLTVSNHLEYLDRFAGEDHLKHLSKYKSHYQKLQSLLREKSEFLFLGEDAKKEEALLSSEIEEIDRLNFKPGELEELEERANRLRSAKLLAQNCSEAQEFLVSQDEPYSSARSSLLQAARHIKKASEIDRRLDNILERVEILAIETEELASELSSYREEFFADPASLEELEARISDLRSLVRKYGRNLTDV